MPAQAGSYNIGYNKGTGETIVNALEQIKEKFKDKVEIFEKSKRRVYINAAKDDTKDIVRYLFKDMGARFSIATAVDTRLGIELLYHMLFDKDGLIVSIRTLSSKPEIEMPTISDIIPGALWIEREVHEMFGVDFIGHPNLERLLLPDDWEEGVYPFRKKSFESEKENPER
jgi:Ni,Fe-hydrogenase III component G